MTLFIADHTGSVGAQSTFMRPVHIGAALVRPEQRGLEPDCVVENTLSHAGNYADLRLYDYIHKAYAGRCAYVAIMQYRRFFTLGTPTGPVAALKAEVDALGSGLLKTGAARRPALLQHLACQSDAVLQAELGDADFVANRWQLQGMSVEQQFLSTIAKTYPDDPRYVEAWHVLRKCLKNRLGGEAVREALDGSVGYFNNCFVTTWDRFVSYKTFLFEVLGNLSNYGDVFRLFGYLAERVFGVYLVARQHRVAARSMVLFL